MTALQFEAITNLMRGDPGSAANRAARDVLVNGLRQAEAVLKYGITAGTVSDAVRRYRRADLLIRTAYLPS